MTCGTLLEFCQEDFPIPPRLPPPPPILSYYFEDNKLNSSFYCEFCSNLEASLDPLHKRYGSGGSEGGFFSPTPQNLTVILFIVAALSAAVGSAITVVWKKWFRCRDGGIMSKAFGASHSSHSADISTSPDGRRRSSRTASLRSGSALQNLQKRLSSSSFISRRSLYQHHPGNITSSHHVRSGGQPMSNNTYCECPSSMMMMMCTTSGVGGGTGVDGGNNLNNSTTSTTTTTSLSPCLAGGVDPSAPSASTLSISTNGGNVYAELDPVSIPQQIPPPPYPAFALHGTTQYTSPGNGIMHVLNTSMPLGILGGLHPTTTGVGNQYVTSHRRRQPAPLPPIPTSNLGNEFYQHYIQDPTIASNNALNISNLNLSTSSNNSGGGGVPPIVGGMNPGPVILSPTGNNDLNQMEMNDLNDIYYSDLDCKQLRF